MRIAQLTCFEKNNPVIKPHTKSMKTVKTVAFKNEPKKLNAYDFGISETGNLTAQEAITMYKELSNGDYLDIGNDSTNFMKCNKVRESNLSFLDRVKNDYEKAKFIEYYKDLTGFPNLSAVSARIMNEFINAVEDASIELFYSKYTVEQAGYDGVCSVGRGKALAGSDIDKAYVVLKGTGDKLDDIKTVNEFKGKIWANTDQRLLSYNHDEAAFPQVFTKAQLEETAEKTNSFLSKFEGTKFYEDVVLAQEKQMGVYNEDYIKANPYFVRVCKCIKDMGIREKVKNVGFVLEAMREGVKFFEFGKLSSSAFDTMGYKYSNLSQLQALKNHSDRKPKRLSRDTLHIDFPAWSIEKQYRFVTAMIKSACANNKIFTTEFGEYFSKPGQDLFAPLIKAMMR